MNRKHIKLTDIIKESEDPKAYSNDLKKSFLEIVSTYSKYQEQLDRKSDIQTIAETLSAITEAARELALNEADDWFDKHTIKRNMSELDKLGQQFDKVAVESKRLDERLTSLYEDMGHILSRYYKVGEISEDEMADRLGMGKPPTKLKEGASFGKFKKDEYTPNPESKLNEVKRFGNWSVTDKDEYSIKLVNQVTADTIYVFTNKGKYEVSYKKRRIIKPSLKQAMDAVLKLEESKKDCGCGCGGHGCTGKKKVKEHKHHSPNKKSNLTKIRESSFAHVASQAMKSTKVTNPETGNKVQMATALTSDNPELQKKAKGFLSKLKTKFDNAAAGKGWVDEMLTKESTESDLIRSMNNGNEIRFYDKLEVLYNKLGHPKYMKVLSLALKEFDIDMFRDQKIKTKADAEEKLYNLTK